MYKRPFYPQEGGDRKKPRLDVSIADHNFPLSQNANTNKADHNDNWGDDIDDEILLQASQACEEACNSSVLPDYSQFRPPLVASTQAMAESAAGPSKGAFTFKVPSQAKTVSTILKDNCGRISSPLRSIRKVIGNELENPKGDFFNEVLNNRDTDYMYKQLLEIREENSKLKSEQSKLLEKCVTKEGEASILRTQLKSYQQAVDGARLEKLKAQEQVQMQWSEKLNTVNNQLRELQTQLDFKNMEIISMKEKCKMLESNKIKLTQITFAPNEMTVLNNTNTVIQSVQASQLRRLKTKSSGVQTETNPQPFKLGKICRIKKSNLTEILPLVTDSATDQQHSILDYNEKLKTPTDVAPNKCIIFSTYHKLSSSTSNSVNSRPKHKINISCIYEDLTYIAASNNDVEKAAERYIKIFKTTKMALEDVQSQLETVSRRLTTAFQKEINKHYIESTAVYNVVDQRDLFVGKALFKEEQAIVARRLTAILQKILEDAKAVHLFNKTHRYTRSGSESQSGRNEFIELVYRICVLLDKNSCALFYSGLLLSIILLIENLTKHCNLDNRRVLDIMKRIISSRGMLFVPCRLLRVLITYYNMKHEESSLKVLCENGGNVKEDYDQGVIAFKNDTCLLQVFLKQVEVALKCMEKQKLTEQVINITRDLLQFNGSFSSSRSKEQSKSTCECDRVLLQVVTYSIRICSSMLDSPRSSNTDITLNPQQTELMGVCRSGLQVLYQFSLTDTEFMSQLRYYEGHLIEFCEHLRRFDHNEFYSTMLSEMTQLFQAGSEQAAPPRAWLHSFHTFSIKD